MIQFGDNDDLGLADGNTPIFLLPYVVKIASKILSDLHKLYPDKNWKHAIQIGNGFTRLTEAIMDELSEQLAEHTQFYAIDGKRIFELRGPSGGVVSARIFYITSMGNKENF